MVSWKLVFTRQAQKNAKKLAAAGLKKNAEALLAVLQDNPLQGSCWIPGWSVTGIIPVCFFKRVLLKIYL